MAWIPVPSLGAARILCAAPAERTGSFSLKLNYFVSARIGL